MTLDEARAEYREALKEQQHAEEEVRNANERHTLARECCWLAWARYAQIRQKDAEIKSGNNALQQRLIDLETRHGSLRTLAKVTGIHYSYLCRLRSGAKTNPGETTLRKLGLKKVVTYVKRP